MARPCGRIYATFASFLRLLAELRSGPILAEFRTFATYANTRRIMIRTTAALLALMLLASPTLAGVPWSHASQMARHYNRGARWFNAHVPWHTPYAHATWRQPVGLIVPPVANMRTSYSWGVGRTRMVPIHHQFTRPYVAPGGGVGVISPAPAWPSSTTHQGVNYIRGPW